MVSAWRSRFRADGSPSRARPSALTAAVIGWSAGGTRWPLALLAAGTIGHTLVTAFAAPTYHSQKRVHDQPALEQIFAWFERLQTARAVVQVATLAAAVWGLATEVTT